MSGMTHRTIDTNGIKMHIAEAGRGPLVLLLQGLDDTVRLFELRWRDT